MRVSVQLGLTVSSRPTIRQLRDRARERLRVVAAGQTALQFLEDAEGVLDLPLLIEDDQIHVSVKIPSTGNQLPLVPRKPVRRGARLRREDDPIDQKLVDEIVAAVTASAEAERHFAELANTIGPAQLQDAVQDFERKTGVRTAALREHILAGAEPFVVDVSGQHCIDFFLPSTIRKTSVSEEQVALYIKPNGGKTNVDFSGRVRKKLAIHAAPPPESQEERLPSDRFELERSYPLRFIDLQPAQHAVLAAAWALALPLGVIARFAVSCATLNPAPAEVDEVISWRALVQTVGAAIAAAGETPIRCPTVVSGSRTVGLDAGSE